jgi:hypothetical protein
MTEDEASKLTKIMSKEILNMSSLIIQVLAPSSNQEQANSLKQSLEDMKLRERSSLEASETHEGISCRRCRVNPIIGVMYRCFICADYILCENCEIFDTHSGEHPIIRINNSQQSSLVT